MDSASVDAFFRNVEGLLGALTILNLTAYQWPEPAYVKDGAKFDFVVVGGGSAGCIVASRLVERNAKVLLIEAGTVPPIESDYAGLFPFLKKSRYDWNFTTTGDDLNAEFHKNDVIHISQGKMLGGSGSLSYGCYRRGYPEDYDEWASITNDSSWSFDSIQPLMCKNEYLTDKCILDSKHYYGTKGRIKIHKNYYKRNRDYFDALEEIGYEYHLDVNPDHPLGFTNLMFSNGDKTRQTAAKKFLSPLKDNKNLYLMLNTLATKIIFDDKKTAIGVEVTTEDKRKIIVKANKEVIVTAGTIKSPQLLMLSGIGPKNHLRSKGIKVIADLPVGKNFQDHVNALLHYKMTKSSLAHNLGDPNEYPYIIFDGYVALNKSQSYPDYETIAVHLGDSLTFLGLCSFFFSYDSEYCDHLQDELKNKELFMVYITYFKPESRGEILLNSKNPYDYPLIYPGYYTKDIDLTKHASYLADFNRILNTTFFKKMKAELVDPKLKPCDGIKRGTMEYWRCHTLGTSDTAHYIIGTCSMGAVVDSQLRVYGVKNLRVADASVIPSNVRALLDGSVMVVARKASDMIIKEYGLKKGSKYC